MIDVKLLGPLALTAGDRQVVLGPQQRVLFLTLLVAKGRLVPSARLAELLWANDGGGRAPATLRSHVAHLRRALDEVPGRAGSGLGRSLGWLVTERMAGGAAYAVRVDPERIDVARFERLVCLGRDCLSAGRWGQAAASFAGALALWRGRPFPDIADRPFAADEVRRLEALHRAAWSGRVEAEVGLGRHREVIGELAAMVTRWPDDEDLRRLLAVGLARSGRMAEAAQVTRDGVEHALSLGLDPSAMRALQSELLGRPRHTVPRR
ncbi:MAG TPA: BTAD domain-containing putative transcriptional regulator [Streptosporangiaceae bacterium]|nr:BTAD domain-containing putative transcriptional regulator [Streptosporangiaceae bacterium]